MAKIAAAAATAKKVDLAVKLSKFVTGSDNSVEAVVKLIAIVMIPIIVVVYISSSVLVFFVVMFFNVKDLKKGSFDIPTNTKLGSLSEIYESNGEPGTISPGNGDPGGKSYGAWQIATKTGTMNTFLNWLMSKDLSLYSQLNLAYTLDGNTFRRAFDSKWVELASKQREYFLGLQWQFIKETHYDPVISYFKKNYSMDFNKRSFTLQNVIWSTAVQHGSGGAEGIIKKYINLIKEDDPKEKDKDIITAIYSERMKVDIYFSNSSEDVQNSVRQRFISESDLALKMLDDELKGG